MMPVVIAGIVAGLAVRQVRARRFRSLLQGNDKLLSPNEKRVVRRLCSQGQSYLFRGWPAVGTRDAEKKRLLAQIVLAQAEGASAVGEETEKLRLQVLGAPRPEKRPHALTTEWGDTRTDNYYWLRSDDRSSPEVLAHLKQEAAYTEAVCADILPLRDQVFKEMRGRIKEEDESAPQRHGAYYYYTRTEEGKQYKVHCRRRVPAPLASRVPLESDVMDRGLPEEVLLDENQESKGHSFYMTSGLTHSPNHKLLAYTVDSVGGERYTLHVRDIATGKPVLTKPIEGTAGDVEWANDSRTLFYTTKDSLDRPHKVWRHVIGSDPSSDALVFHEEDEAFYVGIARSRSDKLVFISSGSAVTSEVRYLDADRPEGEPRVVLPRVNGVEYSVKHRGNVLFLLYRDDSHQNSELRAIRMGDEGSSSPPAVLIPHDPAVKLEHFSVASGHMAVLQRKGGLQVVSVYTLPALDDALLTAAALPPPKEIAFEEPCYELDLGEQGPFDSPVLRLRYSSLATPPTILDYNMGTGARAEKKVTEVRGGFDRTKLRTERLWATAADGTKIPISAVYRSDLVQPGSAPAPMMLYAYGSYEISIDPGFRSDIHSLLDRGWIWAIAHIRGGGEMGRAWYEDGKLQKKKNTFTDFISSAEHLISLGWTDSSKLAISGRSAGGLTMGAVTTMRPDLFRAVILGVPFVDVVTTMQDPSIPLTVIEWGNPLKNKNDYEYMKSYSPVDNVRAAHYPHMLVLAGLHDPRVAYWEPAKFCAVVRDQKLDSNMTLLKCDMGAGHFSQSGRFDKLKETAFEYAWLVKAVTGSIAPVTP